MDIFIIHNSFDSIQKKIIKNIKEILEYTKKIKINIETIQNTNIKNITNVMENSIKILNDIKYKECDDIINFIITFDKSINTIFPLMNLMNEDIVFSFHREKSNAFVNTVSKDSAEYNELIYNTICEYNNVIVEYKKDKKSDILRYIEKDSNAEKYFNEIKHCTNILLKTYFLKLLYIVHPSYKNSIEIEINKTKESIFGITNIEYNICTYHLTPVGIYQTLDKFDKLDVILKKYFNKSADKLSFDQKIKEIDDSSFSYNGKKYKSKVFLKTEYYFENEDLLNIDFNNVYSQGTVVPLDYNETISEKLIYNCDNINILQTQTIVGVKPNPKLISFSENDIKLNVVYFVIEKYGEYYRLLISKDSVINGELFVELNSMTFCNVDNTIVSYIFYKNIQEYLFTGIKVMKDNNKSIPNIGIYLKNIMKERLHKIMMDKSSIKEEINIKIIMDKYYFISIFTKIFKSSGNIEVDITMYYKYINIMMKIYKDFSKYVIMNKNLYNSNLTRKSINEVIEAFVNYSNNSNIDNYFIGFNAIEKTYLINNYL